MPPPGLEARAASQEAVQSEVRILGVLSQFGVMQLVIAATGIVRNKIVALRLGPAAFGDYAQIASVTAVVVAVVTFGMGVSLTRNAAKSTEVAERQRQLANANGLVLAIAGVAMATAAALLAGGKLLPLVGVSHTRTAAVTMALFLMAIPFEALKTNYLALLQAVFDVRGLAFSRSIGMLVATALAVPLVWFIGFTGAGIQYLLLSAMLAVLLGARCRKLGYAPTRLRLERAVVLHLASFGLVSLGSSFAQVFSDTAVRRDLIETAGATANGLLQAPWVLSVTVKNVVTASISSIALATIAPREDPADMAASVDKLLNVVIPVGASAIGLLGLMGAPAMAVLYSKAFIPGAALFRFILAADLLLVFVWVIGAPLLARGDRLLWLLLDVLYAALRWAVAAFLMSRLGATAVVVGYLVAVAVHLSLNLLVYRFRYRAPLRLVHLGRLVVGMALVGFLSVVGGRMPSFSPAPVAAAAIWVAYTVHYARRTGLVEALQRRFARG